jgi:hypothetical protein
MITIELSYQSTDANNGMIDVLGKFIPNFDSNFIIGFALMTISRSKSLNIRNRFNIPNDDVIQECAP